MIKIPTFIAGAARVAEPDGQEGRVQPSHLADPQRPGDHGIQGKAVSQSLMEEEL